MTGQPEKIANQPHKPNKQEASERNSGDNPHRPRQPGKKSKRFCHRDKRNQEINEQRPPMNQEGVRREVTLSPIDSEAHFLYQYRTA